MRNLIIVGNGLGMAMNPNHFLLRRALARVWEDADLLSDEHKGIISRCADTDVGEPPASEDDLDILHRVVSACELLIDNYPDNNPAILTRQGRSLPEVLASFIYEVAKDLFSYREELPHGFVDPLVEHIEANKSHVGVLNYDGLLYRTFLEHGLCDGFGGALVDGFLRAGFSPENLDRRYNNNFGWYLHLHGSPLFYEVGGTAFKMSINEVGEAEQEGPLNLVLTHVRHKPSVIGQSSLLSSYWERLDLAIQEAERIILFGYSGADVHLNRRLLVSRRPLVPFRIVEWSGEGEADARRIYWERQLLGAPQDLRRLDNILDYTDW